MIKYILAVMAVSASPVLAQSESCAPRDVVISNLSGKYGERVVATGLSADGVVEFWANEETGT